MLLGFHEAMPIRRRSAKSRGLRLHSHRDRWLVRITPRGLPGKTVHSGVFYRVMPDPQMPPFIENDAVSLVPIVLQRDRRLILASGLMAT